MTSATVAKTAAKTTQSQAKPEKIRRDHKVNWWLTAVVAVLSLKNSLGAFDQIMALTKGGPDSKTETVSYLIFQNGLGNGEYSYQMANAVTFFIVLAILAFVQLKFFSGKEKV